MGIYISTIHTEGHISGHLSLLAWKALYLTLTGMMFNEGLDTVIVLKIFAA